MYIYNLPDVYNLADVNKSTHIYNLSDVYNIADVNNSTHICII